MNRKLSLTFAGLAIGCLALATGCASRGGILGVDCCADIPAGAVPEPAGTKVCNWQSVQVRNALADQYVLYRSDFVGNTEQLSPAAIQRIARIAHAESSCSMPWVVEPSDETELDQARVQAVIGELTQVGATCLDVTLAVPAAIGLTGPEAEQLGVGFGQGGNIGSRFSNGGTFGGRDFGTFGRVFQ